MKLFLSALVSLFLITTPLCATDLTKIERTIAKEPAYKGKPKYCLLVFGPDAKHRVWLVQDGDVLYVDRNGNADLTEPGNKLLADKEENSSADRQTFKLRELKVGDRVHRSFYFTTYKLQQFAEGDKRAKAILDKDPNALAYLLMIEIERPGWKGGGIGGRVQQRASFSDHRGYLQFSNHAKDAPVIHFDGPLEISTDTLEMKIGRETDFTVGVGSRGLGPGTHTWIDYDGAIPEKLCPIVEIVYPPQKAGAPPLREKYELKERC